jgi:hypothetical protein
VPLIKIKKGDGWDLVKVYHEKNHNYWYYPESKLMCTHEGKLVDSKEWMSKELYWGTVDHAPKASVEGVEGY